jgi:hypothetical protein
MRKEKEVKVESEGEEESEVLKEYKKEKVQFEEKKKTLPKKGDGIKVVLILFCNFIFSQPGTDREAFTMALLAKFQKKLEKVKESVGSEDEEEMVEQPEEPEVADADFGKDEGGW